LLKDKAIKILIYLFHIIIGTGIIYLITWWFSTKIKINLQDTVTGISLFFVAMGVFVFVPATFGGVIFKTVDISTINVITIESETARKRSQAPDFFHLFTKQRIFTFKNSMIGMIFSGVINIIIAICFLK
jgi:hypothetical protein